MLIERIYLMRKYFKLSKPDTIVSFMKDINIMTLISCLGMNKKIIVSERNHPLLNNDGKSKRPFVIRALTRILYPFSYKIVFQTSYAMKCYSSDIQDKGVIIPNAISNNIINPHEGVRSKVIVACGRLVEQKNFKLLIQAFAKIKKIHNDYQLHIYGDGHLKKI